MSGFWEAFAGLKPRTAVVLGSGLAASLDGFPVVARLGYADLPGMPLPTVAGHAGELVLATCGVVPFVAARGRVHFYEGHPWPAVERLVGLFADNGCRRLVLTNAAGGVRADLRPGDLMAIRGHLPLLDRDAWRRLAAGGGVDESPYSPHLIQALLAATPGLTAGVYAAVTGPAYETHAEVRALRQLGADAVGMSTAREALAGAARGLEVAAVSCVTNAAAGLGQGALTHAEVEATARTAAGRLGGLLGLLVG